MKYFSTFLFVFCATLISQSAQAAGPTYVRDGISYSTTWTQDNSPYIIQNDIVVSRGAILTVEPGVRIQFAAPTSGKVGAGPNLVIQGGLRAVGNYNAPIAFEPQATGSLWGALYFNNSDSANCVLQGCLIKGGRIVCNGASPTITQCAIYGAKSGVEIAMNSAPRIVGNRITANGVGIILFSDTASPVITGNEIYNNNYGFYLKDFGTPTITNNKIYHNLKYNIVNYSSKSLAIPNNDFRVADARQITRTIYDGLYNANLGRINYYPYVGMPSGQSTTAMASAPAAGSVEKPKVQEQDFWSYGRPFDAMKISNVEAQKKKPSSAVKVLAVGATAVVTVVLLFL